MACQNGRCCKPKSLPTLPLTLDPATKTWRPTREGEASTGTLLTERGCFPEEFSRNVAAVLEREKRVESPAIVSRERYEATPIPCTSELCRMNGYVETMTVGGDARTCPVCEYTQRVTRTGFVFAESSPLDDDERGMIDAVFAPEWPAGRVLNIGVLVIAVLVAIVAPILLCLLG